MGLFMCKHGWQAWCACTRALGRLLALRIGTPHVVVSCVSVTCMLATRMAFCVRCVARMTSPLAPLMPFVCSTTLVLDHLVQCPKTGSSVKNLTRYWSLINNLKCRTKIKKLPSINFLRNVLTNIP